MSSTNGRLSWSQLWLSPEGRATRFDYWMRYIVPYLIGLIIAGYLDAALSTAGPGGGPGIITLMFIIAALWPGLAVGIKRCHDRDRSGWFLLIALIPIIGSIWLLIELGFLRGTIGANRFGPDPRGGVAVSAAGLTT